MDIIFAVKNVEWLPQFPQLIVPPGSASSDGPWASSQTTTNRICDPSLSKSLMLSFLIWMFPRVNVSLRSQEVEVFEAGKFHKRNLRQSHPYGEGAAMTSLGFSSHLTMGRCCQDGRHQDSFSTGEIGSYQQAGRMKNIQVMSAKGGEGTEVSKSCAGRQTLSRTEDVRQHWPTRKLSSRYSCLSYVPFCVTYPWGVSIFRKK